MQNSVAGVRAVLEGVSYIYICLLGEFLNTIVYCPRVGSLIFGLCNVSNESPEIFYCVSLFCVTLLVYSEAQQKRKETLIDDVQLQYSSRTRDLYPHRIQSSLGACQSKARVRARACGTYSRLSRVNPRAPFVLVRTTPTLSIFQGAREFITRHYLNAPPLLLLNLAIKFQSYVAISNGRHICRQSLGDC